MRRFTRHGSVRRLAPARRRGGAVVEFAVLLPFISMLLFGILELGRMLEVQQVVSNAAREGARHAAKYGNTTQVDTVVQNYLRNCGIEQYTLQIEEPKAGKPSNSVTVTVTVPYADVSILAANSLQWLDQKTMTATVTMRSKEKGSGSGRGPGNIREYPDN